MKVEQQQACDEIERRMKGVRRVRLNLNAKANATIGSHIPSAIVRLELACRKISVDFSDNWVTFRRIRK
jgi:hypothetical protein